MRISSGLMILFMLFATTPADAAEEMPNLEEALIHGTLMGCLLNITGKFPIDKENAAQLSQAGFTPAAAISPTLQSRLALQSDPGVAISNMAPQNIILVASPNYHACTIGAIVTNAQSLRAALKKELEQAGAPWKLQSSTLENNLAMDNYKWHLEGKPDIFINISGPNIPTQDPDGMQLMVRVALVQG